MDGGDINCGISIKHEKLRMKHDFWTSGNTFTINVHSFYHESQHHDIKLILC